MWCSHSDFLKEVKANWEIPARTIGMKKLSEKLFRLKQFLKWWNGKMFGNIFQNIKDMEYEVMKAEIEVNNCPNEHNGNVLDQKKKSFEEALEHEEAYWKQKANCQWILEGERNTAMYHNMAKRKFLKGRIHNIEEQGSFLTDIDQIKNSAVSFFENLFTGEQVNLNSFDETVIPSMVDTDTNEFSLQRSKLGGDKTSNIWIKSRSNCWA